MTDEDRPAIASPDEIWHVDERRTDSRPSANLEKVAMPDRHDRHYPKTGIHGRIVHAIGREICSGALAPRAKLKRDVEMMEQFDASRTAIREALKVLASKGLIESRQRAGTFVRPREEWDLLDLDVLSWLVPENLGGEFIEDLMEMREIIEPAAARIAATRANELDIVRITKAYERMADSTNDFESFYIADRDFHLAVLAACHNDFVDRMSGVIGTILALTFRLQSELDHDAAPGLPAHREVLEKIETGDKRGAERAMRQTITRGRQNIDERMAQRQ